MTLLAAMVPNASELTTAVHVVIPEPRVSDTEMAPSCPVADWAVKELVTLPRLAVVVGTEIVKEPPVTSNVASVAIAGAASPKISSPMVAVIVAKALTWFR